MIYCLVLLLVCCITSACIYIICGCHLLLASDWPHAVEYGGCAHEKSGKYSYLLTTSFLFCQNKNYINWYLRCLHELIQLLPLNLTKTVNPKCSQLHKINIHIYNMPCKEITICCNLMFCAYHWPFWLLSDWYYRLCIHTCVCPTLVCNY